MYGVRDCCCVKGFSDFVIFLIVACLVLRVFFSRVFVSRESWSLPLLQSPTSSMSPLSLSLCFSYYYCCCCCNCYCLNWCGHTRKRSKCAHCAHESHTYSLSEDPTHFYKFYFICRFIIISWFRHSTCQINFTDNGWGCCWWQLTAIRLWIKGRYFQCNTIMPGAYMGGGTGTGNAHTNQMGERNCNLRFSF